LKRSRQRWASHFITFDPADVEEMVLHTAALKAMQEGRTAFEADAAGGPVTLKTADVAQISGDILARFTPATSR